MKMSREREDSKFMGIRDSLCEQLGCSATWANGNRLLVYAGKGRPKTDERHGSDSAPITPLLHQICWDTDMHNRIARKLVNETHNIFLELQQSRPDGHKEASQMLTFSRSYRSVIKACIMDFKSELGNCVKKSEKCDLAGQLELFEMIELIWSICEVLFVEPHSGGLVLAPLLGWLRMHFFEGDLMAKRVLADECPEENHNFWPVVYSFVFQGRLDSARHMLSTLSSSKSDAYSRLDELMRKMPSIKLSSGQSVSDFERRWQHWQDDCRQRMKQAEFVTDRNLETICRILCGEDGVFRELKSCHGTWYSLLISRLLYQNPAVKACDLQYHVQFCVDVFGGHRQMESWDNIILAALEFNIHHVIKESSATLSNWWFVAHLTDLLHHCQKLDDLYFGDDLREFLLLEYSTSLMSHSSLWQVAVDYLDCCPKYGRYYLEQFLERLPLDTEKKALKVLRLCEQRDMQEQIRSICKVQGMDALHCGRLGSALVWALRSKDVNFTSRLADHFLDEYTETGDFNSLDLLDNLGSSMLLSNKLTFLGKYREFHRLYEDGEFKAAGCLLLSLLTARVAPRKFWLTLLTDALPLLESQQPIFSSQQTYELMHCLEELMLTQKLNSINNSTDKDPAQMTSDDGESHKLDQMKLALARNLARTIVIEGSMALA